MSGCCSGTNFYRLKPVDVDGRFTYSKVILLSDGSASLVLNEVRPNPFASQLSLTFHSSSKQPIHLTLVDGSGKEVATKKVAGVQGVNVVQFSNLQALATGMYMLRIVTADGLMQYKLLKAGD